ncbi:MAG: 30S ribosomal protein S4 [Candidatus Aenigmatarchaeota archaeon]
MGTTKVLEEKVEKTKKMEKTIEKKKEVKVVVRVMNTDLDGEKPLRNALLGIRGIDNAMSKAVCLAGGFDPNVRLGSLNEADIAKLEAIIKEPVKYGIPAYMLNRRKEPESGADLHLVGTDLEIAKKFDIQKMINLKTYRGTRHMFGLPVRGQRTRSSFRSGKVVGVVKKSTKAAQRSEGDFMKRSRKKYEKPKRPWDKTRIEREKEILRKFGLKNKKELWRAEAMLRKYRRMARDLVAKKDKEKERELIEKLKLMGILKEGSTLTDVLALTVEDILNRRLQTVVYKMGLANSIKHARQLIVHGHIKIGERKISYPSYVVSKDEENKIGR